jgi:hypothetical protein
MSDDRLLIAATLVAAIAALSLALRVRRWARARRARRRAAHALSGERTAERLLLRAGFRVAERQARHRWSIDVDGDTVTAGVRCDYLVERARERWVAEIKTGPEAPRLDNPATRRQLLEYQVAYGAAGVALVDADTGTVREIRFPLATDAPPANVAAAPWRWLVTGAVVGAALTAAALAL